MGLVNPPEVTPAVMRAIGRYFAYRGEGAEVAREELRALLEPPGAVNTTDGEGPTPVEATMTEAVALGILEESGEGTDTILKCTLALPDTDAPSTLQDSQLVAALRRCVLSEENTGELFAVNRDALDTTKGREFARIGAWLLLQDPLAPGLNYGAPRNEEAVERRQNDQCTIPLVINGPRWVSFRRWARYLGIARMGTDGRLLPDPTAAIGDELHAVFADDHELSPDEFARRLSDRLPLIDGGRCQQEVLRHAFKSDPFRDLPGDRPVSAALSFVLKRLERGGSVRLDDRADAPSYRNVAGGVVTHIAVVTG